MPGRRSDRTRHRSPCAVTLDGRRHNGFLIDYSLSGLFIQTSARPRVGQRLDLELSLHGEKLPVHVEVSRRKTVPAQLRAVAGGGIGVRILSAPEAYYHMIAEQQTQSEGGGAGSAPGGMSTPQPVRAATSRAHVELPPRAAPKPEPPPGPAVVFRVRARALQGNRTRTLQVGADDEEAAARLALEELGESWKVLEVAQLGER